MWWWKNENVRGSLWTEGGFYSLPPCALVKGWESLTGHGVMYACIYVNTVTRTKINPSLCIVATLKKSLCRGISRLCA